MRANPEDTCKLAESLDALDGRVGKLEVRMDKMEGSLADGFRTLSASVSALGHDFGERMTNLDTRLIESKIRWGEWARSSLNAVGGWLGKWGGIIILAALGLSNAKSIADIIRGWCT